MLSEYQEKVLVTYKKKCEAGGPSLILSKPTTAKLKKECLRIYDKRYTSEDDDILSTFFNVDKIGIDFRKTIAKATPGTFRALWNHLNNDSIKTNERNSDLLAWLIDFKPRPSFRYYQAIREGQKGEDEPVGEENPNADSISSKGEDPNKTNSPSTTEEHKAESLILNLPQELKDKSDDNPTVIVIDTDEARANEVLVDDQHRPETTDTISDDDNKSTGKTNIDPSKRVWITQKIIFSAAIIIIFGMGTFLFMQDKIDRETITKEEKCMYWTGSRYEAVACNVKTSSAKIPLDTAVLHQLKKINEPDTLTQQSIGKVWYGKVNGKPEFYAASGTHPLDANKRLMPLTNYMLTKYVSYHRYQLKMLIWSIGGLLIISVLTLLVFKFFAKRSVAKKA